MNEGPDFNQSIVTTTVEILQNIFIAAGVVVFGAFLVGVIFKLGNMRL